MTENHAPDILSCIANLSNDEVFTPPKVANAMLDLLPQELFANPKTTFLDPCCKSGVFLREIAKRLLVGLADKIPDLQRRIDHIFHNQLFGLALTDLTGLTSRRSVYCSKDASGKYSVSFFKNPQGHIRYTRCEHDFQNGKCRQCGASQSEYDRGAELETHAYSFIHSNKVFNDMQFDVIIGNPPYQLSDGGSAGGAIPIYQKFVKQAICMNPRYLTMIIPSRWFAGGRGLEEFRKEMLSDSSLKVLVDYPKSRECFQGVDIAGGVCYFLRENGYAGTCEVTSKIGDKSISRQRKLDEFGIFIRDNIGIDIVHKIKNKFQKSFAEQVLPVSPFGLRSFIRGQKEKFKDALTLISSAGESFLLASEVKKGKEFIGKYKVSVGYLNPDRAGVNNASDGKSSVTTKVRILRPNEVITETYIILGCFDSLTEAENCSCYVKTKFFRYLVLLTLSSMHITKSNFQFVPVQDFSKPWTDAELYEKYGLNDEEITLIESMIRPME